MSRAPEARATGRRPSRPSLTRGGCLISLAALACAPSDTPTNDAPYRLEPVARYGSRDGAGAALTRVAGVVSTPDHVFVLEARPPRVAVFTHDGAWLRDLGREGDGPGELRSPQHIGVTQDGIGVGDPPGGRLEIFSADGSSVRSIRWALPADSLGTRSIPIAVVGSRVLAGPVNLPIGGVIRGTIAYQDYFGATADGSDPTRWYRSMIHQDDFTSAELPSGGVMIGVHPLRYSPLVAIHPAGAGIAVVERPEATSAEDAVFRLLVFDEDGVVTVDREIPYRPIEAEGWLDAHLARLERDMLDASGEVDRTFLRLVRENLVSRRFYPAVTDVVAGADGTVWVERGGPVGDSLLFEVFDTHGARVRTVKTRADVELQHATLEEAWAVVADEYGVPFVYRMRVVR